MSASGFVQQAETESSGRHGGICRGTKKWGRKSLNAGACCCHPPAWGLKKGLRRGRRRFANAVVAGSQKSSSGKNYRSVMAKKATRTCKHCRADTADHCCPERQCHFCHKHEDREPSVTHRTSCSNCGKKYCRGMLEWRP